MDNEILFENLVSLCVISLQAVVSQNVAMLFIQDLLYC